MSGHVIRDDEHAFVVADIERALFRLVWKGYVPSTIFRAILRQAVVEVKQHGLRYWLSDSRQLGAILREDELWVKDDLMSQMFRMGVERIAIVMSHDFFTRMATHRLVDQGRQQAPFPVRMFESEVDAELWLFAPKVSVA